MESLCQRAGKDVLKGTKIYLFPFFCKLSLDLSSYFFIWYLTSCSLKAMTLLGGCSPSQVPRGLPCDLTVCLNMPGPPALWSPSLEALGQYTVPQQGWKTSLSTVLLGRYQTTCIMHDSAASFGESRGRGEGLGQGNVEPAALWNASLEREEAAELRLHAPGTSSIVPLYFT